MKKVSLHGPLTFDEMKGSLERLPKTNRWVQMGDSLPWSEYEKVYNKRLKNDTVGACNRPGRMAIAALIIKHKLGLSDEETILAIQENPYMQYMCGLTEYSDRPIFDPSLFTTIRKRITIDDINALTLLDLIGVDDETYGRFNRMQKRTIQAVIDMYHQQETMLRAKIGVSIVSGYSFIDHHSWDAYNEASDLTVHIGKYKERFGSEPERFFGDKIYLNRANRKILKEKGIKIMGRQLGRPPKNPSQEQLERERIGVSLRNEAEAQFSIGKRTYRANDMRARLPETARCWTAMCYFFKNLAKYMRELCLVLIGIYVRIRHIGSKCVNQATKLCENSCEEHPFPLCGTQTF